MRLSLLAYALVFVAAACGGSGQSSDKSVDEARDDRIGHWAELLAQRAFDQLSPSICDLIENPDSLALADDPSIISQIPKEDGPAVSRLMMEKLQSKCAAADECPTPSPGWDFLDCISQQ